MNEFCSALPVCAIFALSLSHPTNILRFPILSPTAPEGSEWLPDIQILAGVKTAFFQYWSVLCKFINTIALFFSSFVL